ncbi:hypothetical protein Pmani_029224 [Petrolisthes manimaculis]|uniref:Uncharacterized protein n=1 Tax=Petrolisthes manimaculis TaxID=1843537 RepID=A0AAE1P0H1_9EUCA|nr:hypothetical protein Pmani_029224 [Petrolisthes manimaculis]
MEPFHMAAVFTLQAVGALMWHKKKAEELNRLGTTMLRGRRRKENEDYEDDDNKDENINEIGGGGDGTGWDDSDDDDDDNDAPDAVSLSTGRERGEAKAKQVKQEVQQLREKAREKRRKRHEKNKLQQEAKRRRLEKLAQTRMPESLLDAVAAEQEEGTEKQTIDEGSDGEEDKGKLTTFDEEDDIIPVKTGVQVQTLKQQVTVSNTLAQKAADFKHKKMYGDKRRRMKSSQLRIIKEKKKWK